MNRIICHATLLIAFASILAANNTEFVNMDSTNKIHSLLNNTNNLSDSELNTMKSCSFRNTLGEYISWFTVGKGGNSNTAKKHFYGKDKHQYILQFIPDGNDIKKTLVIYIHGGGWNHFEPDDFKYVGAFFSNLGYPTTSLGYRLTPKNKYPAQIEDVLTGYSTVIQNLKEQHLQIDNIIIVGFSAGAHLGGLIAYNKELQDKYGVKLLPIKGFCSISGPLRFESAFGKDRSANHMLNMFFEKGFNRSNAEPYNFISPRDGIQVLCIHSLNDPLCNYQTSVEFLNKVNQNGSALGDLYLETDKHIHHTNLGIGMFLKDMPARQVLVEWLNKISE